MVLLLALEGEDGGPEGDVHASCSGLGLGERKVLVVQGLMDEAEVESSRCEGETERCNQELQIDDERMEMTDEQSRAVSKFKLYFNSGSLGV